MTEKMNGISANVNDFLIKKYVSAVPFSYELLDDGRSARGRRVVVATADEQREEYEAKVADWHAKREQLDKLECYMEERGWFMSAGGYEYEPDQVLPLRDWTKWIFDDEDA